jgi:MFS transporter, DHA1 family, inner membrane transport protein
VSLPTQAAVDPGAVPHEAATSRALWALLIGNFAIGTGVLLPAGMISDLATDLSVSVTHAGWLILAGGIVIGIGAPLFAALTTRVDRRQLLLAAMALYAAGHALSIVAPNFETLLAIRIVTIVAAGIFSPQAAATVGLLVPSERRAGAVAFIFLGWSIASVAGIPLASLIAHYVNWRLAFAAVGLLSVLGFAMVWQTIPRGLKGAPLSLASWTAVFTSPALLIILLVTIASASGQFALLTFLQPLLQTVFAASAPMIALTLTVFGVAGILGNTIASRFVGTWGVSQTVLALVVLMAAGFALITLSVSLGSASAGPMALALAMLGIVVWGLGTFGSNSLQQARLISLAPPLASASVALNTSAIYNRPGDWPCHWRPALRRRHGVAHSHGGVWFFGDGGHSFGCRGPVDTDDCVARPISQPLADHVLPRPCTSRCCVIDTTD